MAFYNYGMGMSRENINIAAGGIAGGVVGALQTMLLREFVDDPMATAFQSGNEANPPFLMKELKGFGSPSAIIGIAGGAVGLALGLLGMLKGKLLKAGGISAAFAGYGAVALFTGILSGLYPTSIWSTTVASDPNNPVGVSKARRLAVHREAPAVAVSGSSNNGLLKPLGA
jgi:hypothetical protein